MSEDDLDHVRPLHEVARFRIRGSEARATAPRRSRPSRPMVILGSYSEADWDAESFAVFAEGGDPCPCPRCERTGFYAPRFMAPAEKIRMCRFCGFAQRIGAVSKDWLPTVHRCGQWPVVSKAPYIWWVDPACESYQCVFCQGTVDVPVALVTVPNEDQNHPWWRVPQGRSQSFYRSFWKNWEVTDGRIVL